MIIWKSRAVAILRRLYKKGFLAMHTKIDWLSWTMAILPTHLDNESFLVSIEQAFENTFGSTLYEEAFGGSWERQERGRAPYSHAWRSKNGGMMIFAHPDLGHCSCEVSGEGCTLLIESGLIEDVLSSVAEHVTRIDVACDILT